MAALSVKLEPTTLSLEAALTESKPSTEVAQPVNPVKTEEDEEEDPESGFESGSEGDESGEDNGIAYGTVAETFVRIHEEGYTYVPSGDHYTSASRPFYMLWLSRMHSLGYDDLIRSLHRREITLAEGKTVWLMMDHSRKKVGRRQDISDPRRSECTVQSTSMKGSVFD